MVDEVTTVQAGKILMDYHNQVAGTHTDELAKLVAGENARNSTVNAGETARNNTVNAKLATLDTWKAGALPEFKGAASAAPNLIHNALMENLDEFGVPAGWRTMGEISIEAVHPFTQAFEHAYAEVMAENYTSDHNLATMARPYWASRYYAGARTLTGGLASGWGTRASGRILKITASPDASGSAANRHRRVKFETVPFWARRIEFSAYVKIVSGSAISLGNHAGHTGSLSDQITPRSFFDEGPEGWNLITYTNNITPSFNAGDTSTAFSIGFDADEAIEVYLAMPYMRVPLDAASRTFIGSGGEF